MTRYSKLNFVYRLQKWMDSVPGQTFLNYAYSWGASIVILGTLFKLTHLPGANLMLYLGMGTEVVVFFLSAFDRPFDKTAIGMELPTHVGLDVRNSRKKRQRISLRDQQWQLQQLHRADRRPSSSVAVARWAALRQQRQQQARASALAKASQQKVA